MFRYLSLLCVMVLAISCQRTSSKEVSLKYYDDGKVKPVVELVSLIDSTSSELPWSLSDEMTSLIRSSIIHTGTLYLPKETKELAGSKNPFSLDLSWIKKQYPNAEFVVFTELVEHEKVPARTDARAAMMAPFDVSSNLVMSIRLRIIDNRSATPKVVLQEVVRDSYFIPKTVLKPDYSKVVWGSEDYKSTPMALAHNQIVKDIAERIHDYVFLSVATK